MTTHIRYGFFVFLLCLLGTALAAPSSVLEVIFFGSSTCGECMTIKETLLKPLERQYAGRIDLKIYDLDQDSAFQLLLGMEKAYGVTASSPQELFLPDTFIIGYDQIMASAKMLIEQRLQNPAIMKSSKSSGGQAVSSEEYAKTLKSRMHAFSMVGLTIAGLLDGINPCAIATMIFMISFMTVKKRSRREILMIGMAYTATVYVTYLLMGIGALEIILQLVKTVWISRVIKWGAILFAMTVAVLSVRDAIKFKKSGKASDIMLQMPKGVKTRIHSIISQNLSSRQLLTGSIISGFLVTLLEAVCTGQFYLPVLTALAAQHDARALGYLLYYNFLFVLPLLIVMIAAYQGLKWEQLSKTMQQNLPLTKTLLAIALTGLSVYLFFAMK